MHDMSTVIITKPVGEILYNYRILRGLKFKEGNP